LQVKGIFQFHVIIHHSEFNFKISVAPHLKFVKIREKNKFAKFESSNLVFGVACSVVDNGKGKR